MKRLKLTVNGHDSGYVVEMTETAAERMRGLLGRVSMSERGAMLLQRCKSVHTFGMHFPIDIVFLDRRNRVLSVHANVLPGRMRIHLLASTTLELGAGEAASLQLEKGDLIEAKDSV